MAARLAAISAAVVLALGLAACSRPNIDARQISWTLEDDLAAYRRAYSGQREMIYRVDELAVALQSAEYRAFLEVIGAAPAARQALIYYEAAPNASHYVFALAVENFSSCTVIVSDLAGVRESECQHIPSYEAEVAPDTRAVRDPAVAGLVQFGLNGEERRAMTLLSFQEPLGLSANEHLFDKIERVFNREER